MINEYEKAAMYQRIGAALNKISETFVPEYRLSFIGRLPGNNEADVLVTNELNLDDLKDVIDRTKERSQTDGF